jgi:hypothetical protein
MFFAVLLDYVITLPIFPLSSPTLTEVADFAGAGILKGWLLLFANPGQFMH